MRGWFAWLTWVACLLGSIYYLADGQELEAIWLMIVTVGSGVSAQLESIHETLKAQAEAARSRDRWS